MARVVGRLDVLDAASYRGDFPKFTQPKEVARFSRDASRYTHFDKRSLRAYRPAALPAPLDEGFEDYRPRQQNANEPAPMGDVLSALAHVHCPMQHDQIITYRNNLNKLFLTPYCRSDDWEMGLERAANGSVHLLVRETARKRSEEAARSEREQHMAYWGYRFEQLSTLTSEQAAALARARVAGGAAGGSSGGGSSGGYRVPSPSDAGSYDELYSSEDLPELKARYAHLAQSAPPAAGVPTVSEAIGAVDANEEYCSVVAVSIAKVRLLMAAEIDCRTEGTKELKPGYVELKTSKQLRSQRDQENFEKHKLLKYWLQSFLAGVPSIVVGFRDEAGKVVELKALETMAIPRSVRPKGYWDPTVCFNFGKAVLEWLLEQLAKRPAGAPPCVLRYAPEQSVVLLVEGTDAASFSGDGHAAKRARTAE